MFGFVLTVSIFLAACTKQSASLPSAATLLSAIPAADNAKFPSLEESKHWSNPYLVVRPAAIGLLTNVSPDEEQMLKPEEVLNALAQLPASAWPYGRAAAILVEEKPNLSETEKVAIRRSRGIVEGDLKSAGVAIRWIAGS